MPELKLTLVVACALVDTDKRILLAQRPEGKTLAGLWAFPGGKVEPGERPEETLIRELHEENGITVAEPCLAPLTFASHDYPDFHLLMPLYVCRRFTGTPHPMLAALLGFIPGVGAMYNGQYAKAIAHVVIFAVLASLSPQSRQRR